MKTEHIALIVGKQRRVFPEPYDRNGNNFDGKKRRNGDLFKAVADKLSDAGLIRTVEQMRQRWKTLKASYVKAKKTELHQGFWPFQLQLLFNDFSDVRMRPMAIVAYTGI